MPAHLVGKGRASLFGFGLPSSNREEEALTSHPGAKLTPDGRLLVVTRVVEFGWTPAQTAADVGVSRATAYKWLRRFRRRGRPAFLDQNLPTPPFSTRVPPRASRGDPLCAQERPLPEWPPMLQS